MCIGRYKLRECARFRPFDRIGWKQRRMRICFFEILKDRRGLSKHGVSDAKGWHKTLRVYASIFFRRQGRDRDVFVLQPLDMERNPNALPGRVLGLRVQLKPVRFGHGVFDSLKLPEAMLSKAVRKGSHNRPFALCGR